MRLAFWATTRSDEDCGQGNDELLRSCYPEVTDPYLKEIVMHDPDGASRRLVEALWERLYVV